METRRVGGIEKPTRRVSTRRSERFHRSAPIRFPLAILGLLLALLGALALSILFGSTPYPAPRIFAAIFDSQTEPTLHDIVFNLRLPRAFLAAVVGAGLACAGVAYQAVFRNPLADPFVTGASSGGAVGAVLAIITGWAGTGGSIGPVSLAAFLGATLSVWLVYSIAAVGRLPPVALLLAGATVSTVLGAVVWLLIAWFDTEMVRVVGWLMGGLSGASWDRLLVAGPLVAMGGMLLGLLGRPLDAIVLGEESARALGLKVGGLLLIVLFGASLAVGACVAVGGIIGFVGLIAPHLARPLVGASHSRLLPTSALIGAMVLVLADLLARTIAAPLELPLGVLTALIGGPMFLVVLRLSARKAGGLG